MIRRSDTQDPAFVELTNSIGYASSTHVVERDAQLPPHTNHRQSQRDVFDTRTQPHLEGLLSAYLDIRAQLPVRKAQNALIDLYFEQCNWFFGLIERSYFNDWQAEWEVLEKSTSSSEVLTIRRWRFTGLLFQLLAVALQFLEPGGVYTDLLDIADDSSRTALAQRYSENGLRIMSLAGQYNADLMGVHHGLLRTFWLKNAGRGKGAWFTLGECIK